MDFKDTQTLKIYKERMKVVRDKGMDMDLLEKAARTNPTDPMVRKAIDKKILQIIMDEDEIDEDLNDDGCC